MSETKKTYRQKLQDPRWQKKRLETLERHDWSCLACGCNDRALHVHHIAYADNPWESPDEDLMTLCEECHSALGPHPHGGCYFSAVPEVEDDWSAAYTVIAYRHCPECGCTEDASHSGCVVFACGHTVDPPPAMGWHDWQQKTPSGDPAYVYTRRWGGKGLPRWACEPQEGSHADKWTGKRFIPAEADCHE